MEATEDFSQLRLRFIDPTQYSYELIRPVVLYANRVGERSEATQVDPATIRDKAKRFVEQGMVGLIDGRAGAAGRKGHEFPEPVASLLLYCKKIWPDIRLRELGRIVERKLGYKTNHHTVKSFLERNPIPIQLKLELTTFHEFEDAYKRRYEVIRMFFDGWNKASIAGVLRLSLNHVCDLIAAYQKDGFAALEDHRTRPAQHPDNQLTLPFLEELAEIQREYPRAGAYRVKALLERKREEAGNADPVPSQRSISRGVTITRLFMAVPGPWPPPPFIKAPPEPGPPRFDPVYRHQYWFIDIRYLVRLDGHWVYSICILEGYSRCFLAGMCSEYQDELAILQLLHAALAEHGCPETIVSDNGGVFVGPAFEGVVRGLGIAHPTIERGKPWQNLIEAQFKVQLRLADAKFEEAKTLAEMELRHAEFLETFNTTAHWAHRHRDDGLRKPQEVLAGVRGKPVDPDELADRFKGEHAERCINAHGRIRIQRFSLYAERGLARRRVSVWLHDGWLRIEHDHAILAQYRFKTQRRRKAIKSISSPKLFLTHFASPQLEICELDEEQWLKIVHLPPPAPRRPRAILLAHQLPLSPTWDVQPASLAEALFAPIHRDE